MESFSDPVGFGEAEHPPNFISPCVKSFSKRPQWIQGRRLELRDHLQEVVNNRAGVPLVDVLGGKDPTETLFELVDLFETG